MKKNVLALSIAAAVVGFAGSAHAIIAAPEGAGHGPGNDATGAVAPAATTLRFGDTGTGHMLLVPYYTTQNNNMNLISLINTDTVNGKAVKVRFRGAKNSDDVFDFQVFLSPGDVWTANVGQDQDGKTILHTDDKSCTKPDVATLNSRSFSTTRVSSKNAANEVREGYIEIFNMADVTPDTPLFKVIKHVSGVAPCKDDGKTTAWATIDKPATPYADLVDPAKVGMSAPTTGLAANWTIMNVPKALSWSGTATAIEAVTDDGLLGSGHVVYFPQNTTVIPTATYGALIPKWTSDPLFVKKAVAPSWFDLPDLSTPYTTAAATAPAVTKADQQATILANAIATTQVMNEFWTEDSIFAETDWVFSMPTRRYAVAVDYAKGKLISNAGVSTHFRPSAEADAVAGTPAVEGNVNLRASDDAICVTGVEVMPWDREEGPEGKDPIDVSPGVPGVQQVFCGEASVLGFSAQQDATNVLGASVAANYLPGIASIANGWVNLTTPGIAKAGLPILGQAFVKAVNPSVEEGTAGNFSINWGHRFVRPIAP